jgi:hypothetical protein
VGTAHDEDVRRRLRQVLVAAGVTVVVRVPFEGDGATLDPAPLGQDAGDVIDGQRAASIRRP